MIPIHNHPEGLIFKIFVQPRSSKNKMIGVHGDALKIKLTAPPVDNAANKMCVNYLAKCLGVSKSSIEILSGQTGRTKLILVKPKSGEISEKKLNGLKKRIASLVN